MVKVKLIGAGGYGGIGLVELLHRHPQAELAVLVDVQGAGEPLSAMWPYLRGFCDLRIVTPDSPQARDTDAEVTFCATPDRVGMANVETELAAGRKFIDYSGDFRFNSAELYAGYASRIGLDPEHSTPQLLPESVYGLPELHREEIAAARLVGNPGCFAVSCILALAPAVRQGLVETTGIVCDCKTGVSGGGKKPRSGFHYPEQYDSGYAYRLGGHQHVMEIERELSGLAGESVRVTFTPQVVPMTRGIITTVYGRLAAGANQERVLTAYREAYAREPFVLVTGADEPLATGVVRGSNRAGLTVACDERTGTLRVISHIDNLVKGQAGSALQNMNIMFGLEETLGLDQPGAHP